MMRIKALALCIAVLVGLLAPTLASAKQRHHRVHRTSENVLVSAPEDAFFAYPDAFGNTIYNGYIGEPTLYGSYRGDGSCMFVRHRIPTPYGWRFRLVQICG